MSYLSFFLLGAICAIFAPTVLAMECTGIPGVLDYKCPTFLHRDDEIFCCAVEGGGGVQGCCNIEDFMRQNSGVIAAIVIGAVVILLIVTLCCCCFCSCCCLAKRRVQRGHVLYGPVDGAQIITTAPNYQVIHSPPATQAYSPPPYNPNQAASQPPLNPYYK